MNTKALLAAGAALALALTCPAYGAVQVSQSGWQWGNPTPQGNTIRAMDFNQGRGYAKRLMRKVIQRQLARGEIPVLHVMSANRAAHDFYLRMGFRDYGETVVRVVTPV